MAVGLYTRYYPNRHSSLRHSITPLKIEKLRDRGLKRRYSHPSVRTLCQRRGLLFIGIIGVIRVIAMGIAILLIALIIIIYLIYYI